LANPRDTVSMAYLASAKRIHAALQRSGVPEGRAEEIVQEGFLKLYEALLTGETIHQPAAWVMTVAKRMAIDHLRSAGVRLEHSFWGGVEKGADSDLPVTPEPEVAAPEPDNASVYVQVCVEQRLADFAMDRPTEAGVIKDQLDGVPIARIAASIGRSEGATRTFLYEAKKKFRDYLEVCRHHLTN